MLAGVEVTGAKAAGIVALLGIIVLGGAVGVSVFGHYRRVLAHGYVDVRDKAAEPLSSTAVSNRGRMDCWTSWGETRACDNHDALEILRKNWTVLPGAALSIEVPQCADKTLLHLWLRQTSAGQHRFELCENDAHQLVEIETNPPRTP